MTNKTKLLTMVTDVIESQNERELTEEQLAQEVIETVAGWFEDVLKEIGIQPSAIPALLHWQAYQHEYMAED